MEATVSESAALERELRQAARVVDQVRELYESGRVMPSAAPAKLMEHLAWRSPEYSLEHPATLLALGAIAATRTGDGAYHFDLAANLIRTQQALLD